MTFEKRTAIWKSVIKSLASVTDDTRKEYYSFFKDQAKEVIANYRRAAKDVNANVIFDEKKWNTIISNLTLDVAPNIIAEIFILLPDTGSLDPTTFMVTPEAKKYISDLVDQTKKVNATTLKRLKKILEESVANSDSISSTAAKINKIIKNPKRARMIARTIVIPTNNFTTVSVGKQLGHKTKTWITSRDQNVRDAHLIDGTTVKISESFTLTDGRGMMFPSDPNERCISITNP